MRPFHHALLAVLMLLPLQTKAEFFVGPGATSASFLKVPLAARAAALSGAFTAVSGDVTALDYNPAGIEQIYRKDIGLSYINYVEDSSLQSVAIAFPIRTSGIEKKRRESPGTFKDRLFLGAQYKSFQTDDQRRSVIGQKQGEFDVRDELIQLTMGFSPVDSFSFGFGGKFIGQKIQDESARSYAFDLGFIWHLNSSLSAGASVLNVGPAIEFLQEDDPLPLTARSGVSYQLSRFNILGDVSLGRDQILQPATAVEWNSRYVSFRLGTLFHTTWEFSGGLGINLAPWTLAAPRNPRTPFDNAMKRPTPGSLQIGLDYAVQTRNELGLNHTITFNIHL